MRGPIDPEKLNLMKAALPNVAFDGWSPSTFSAACEEANIPETKAKLICLNGFSIQTMNAGFYLTNCMFQRFTRVNYNKKGPLESRPFSKEM